MLLLLGKQLGVNGFISMGGKHVGTALSFRIIYVLFSVIIIENSKLPNPPSWIMETNDVLLCVTLMSSDFPTSLTSCMRHLSLLQLRRTG